MRLADLEQAGRKIVQAVVQRTLARLPLSATTLTVSGTLLNLVVAALLAHGDLRWGAAALLLAGSFDMFDGALARCKGQASELGAFLDATLDRCSEILVGLGLWLHLLQRGSWVDQLLLYLFISGSLLFSYTRARAEAQGLRTPHAVFDRPVRLLLLALGLLLGQLRPALWLLAPGVWAGALYRLLNVYLQARPQPTTKHPSSWRRHVSNLAERFPLKR
ncbi:MAG: CDP-alcohol phosphatidyltransferase family protein [Chloroflexia bacterium]|nr:CDP-alcohol phosphatidyltransferase family protein [Chloroflexia bacterium]